MSRLSWLHAQLSACKRGGWPVIRRKLSVLLGLAFGAVGSLLIRLLRPLIRVRLGMVRTDRIGHFTVEPMLYLCQRHYAPVPGVLDLLYYQAGPEARVCNQQLKRMVDRVLTTYPWAYWIDRANGWWKDAAAYRVDFTKLHRDVSGGLSPLLGFTKEEVQDAQAVLREAGIDLSRPIVCFTSRDSAYLDTQFPQTNWVYHSYRDSSVASYLPAASWLVEQGYTVLRMGQIVAEALPPTPGVIDYARSPWRCELLDLYLSSLCHFFLGGLTGLEQVPLVFRRPRVIVNAIPLHYLPACGPRDLLLLKGLWATSDSRWLTFPEIFQSAIGSFLRTEQYTQAGLEPRENTPEEILAVVQEQHERLAGRWRDTVEDVRRQAAFWALAPVPRAQVFRARIGADFLRQRADWLRVPESAMVA